MSEPRFFASAEAWRRWLDRNHATATELLVGFHKVASGRGGLTYKQALDAALAYGWIDGVRRGAAEHHTIRFTPRKPKSIWSAINIQRVAELETLGLMHAAGRAAFAARDPVRQKRYSYENRDVAFDPAYAQRFRADEQAWENFAAMPPSYRRPATWWVMSAVRPETREKRLATLIADSAAGKRVKHLTPYPQRGKK